MPTVGDFRPQPEGGEASSFDSRLAASPPGGTGRVFAHGIAIGRLVGVKHTAAAAVSPCTKIATVAHAGIGQRLPYFRAGSFFSSSSARFFRMSSNFDFAMSSVCVASARSRGRRSSSFFCRSAASGPLALPAPVTATLA